MEQVGATHVNPGDGLRFDDYNIAIQAAIAGQGAIIGSIPVLKDIVAAGQLVNPFHEIALTDIGYDLVTTNAAILKDEVKKFRDWIVSEASSY